MTRWVRPAVTAPMDSVGAAVSAGEVAIARRHGAWFDELIVHSVDDRRDGPAVAGALVAAARDLAPVHVVVLDPGRDPVGHLRALALQVEQVDERRAVALVDRLVEAAGRERDPIALPDDPCLLAPLCGRQRPDVLALAVATALIETPRRDDVRDLARGHDRNEFDPFAPFRR